MHENDMTELMERKITLSSKISPMQDLSFNYLTDYYKEKRYKVGDNLLTQLEMFTQDGEFNYLAYLLSDQNALQFQYARYDGDDVFDLIEHKTFEKQSIVKTTEDILAFLQNRNSTFSQITPTGRIDKNRFNPI